MWRAVYVAERNGQRGVLIRTNSWTGSAQVDRRAGEGQRFECLWVHQIIEFRFGIYAVTICDTSTSTDTLSDTLFDTLRCAWRRRWFSPLRRQQYDPADRGPPHCIGSDEPNSYEGAVVKVWLAAVVIPLQIREKAPYSVRVGRPTVRQSSPYHRREETDGSRDGFGHYI